MTVPTPASKTTVDSELKDVVDVMDKMVPLKRGKCEGILPNYRGQLEDLLKAYCVYATIDDDSLCKVGYVAWDMSLDLEGRKLKSSQRSVLEARAFTGNICMGGYSHVTAVKITVHCIMYTIILSLLNSHQ